MYVGKEIDAKTAAELTVRFARFCRNCCLHLILDRCEGRSLKERTTDAEGYMRLPLALVLWAGRRGE